MYVAAWLRASGCPPRTVLVSLIEFSAAEVTECGSKAVRNLDPSSMVNSGTIADDENSFLDMSESRVVMMMEPWFVCGKYDLISERSSTLSNTIK